MGNRAVITASKEIDIQESKDIGVYLHWNAVRPDGQEDMCLLRRRLSQLFKEQEK